MDADAWDERYRSQDLVWSATPNEFVAAELSGKSPGRALDVAAGEGRNAVWLAEQGWQVTALDFSPVAVAKGRALAQQRGVSVHWVIADVTEDPWPQGPYDLVVVAYLQLPIPEEALVLARAGAAVAPGGMLLVVGHDRSNLERGHGGPSQPEVLLTADAVADAAERAGLDVERAEVVAREVATDDGPREALDTLVLAGRPR